MMQSIDDKQWDVVTAIEQIDKFIAAASIYKSRTQQYLINIVHIDGVIDLEQSEHPMDDIIAMMRKLRSGLLSHYGRMMYAQGKVMDSEILNTRMEEDDTVS